MDPKELADALRDPDTRAAALKLLDVDTLDEIFRAVTAAQMDGYDDSELYDIWLERLANYHSRPAA